MSAKSARTNSDASSRPPKYTLTPEAAYQQTQPPRTQFLTPKTFHSAINKHLDNPWVSLYRCGSRIFQFVFALAAGISYAIELSNGNVAADAKSAFIYAEVVFGLTIVTLIVDAVIIRSYRLTWMAEWMLCILWFTLFAVFYVIYRAGSVDAKYARVDVVQMKSIVWVDLLNALLWFASSLFSTTMCCSGIKGKVRGMKEQWHQRRSKKAPGYEAGEMETGTV